VTVSDDDLGTDSAGTTVTVDNVPPQLANVAVTSPIDENDVATLTGSITDPGTLDTFTVTVDWGDGSPVDTFSYAAGTTTFSETHQYLDDDPSGTSSDNCNIAVTVNDDDLGADSDGVLVTVNNVAPQLANIVVTSPIDENDFATLSGDIIDPGTLDTFTLTVDWGDGNIDMYNYGAGTTSFSETHQYQDDNPTGTPSGTYPLTLSIVDDDGGSTTFGGATLVNGSFETGDLTGWTIIDNGSYVQTSPTVVSGGTDGSYMSLLTTPGQYIPSWGTAYTCAQCEMFAALARLIARVIAFLRHDGLADSR